MGEGLQNQPDAPQELWRIAIDAVARIKSAAATRAGVTFRDLKREDWELEASKFLEANATLCDALYRKFWWDYAAAETAKGRRISSIRNADEPGDCPQDELYPLVNAVVLRRSNNQAFISQILDEYEEAHPGRGF